MIIVMKAGATQEDLERVIRRIEEMGYKPHVIRGVERSVVGAVGDERGKSRLQYLEVLPGVESVVPILKPYKLASHVAKLEKTVIEVAGVEIGGSRFVVIAGPCAVESKEQIITAAQAVKEAGAHILRGGAYKPRSSPYSFQGMEEEGLKLLAEARERFGDMLSLPLVIKFGDDG